MNTSSASSYSGTPGPGPSGHPLSGPGAHSHDGAGGFDSGEGPRTITKKELVARIAERTGQTKVVAKDVIQLFLDEIIRELGNGNRLEFREFGVFEIKERAARKAQNPRTLEKVDVPAKRVVKFKVGRLMKECVAEADAAALRAASGGGSGASGGGGATGGIGAGGDAG
jgi:integration host factor subunit beta